MRVIRKSPDRIVVVDRPWSAIPFGVLVGLIAQLALPGWGIVFGLGWAGVALYSVRLELDRAQDAVRLADGVAPFSRRRAGRLSDVRAIGREENDAGWSVKPLIVFDDMVWDYGRVTPFSARSGGRAIAALRAFLAEAQPGSTGGSSA